MAKKKSYLMNTEIANSLAESIIEQYSNMPFAIDLMNLRPMKATLTKILETTPVWEDPQGRMQFKVEKDEKHNKIEESGNSGHLIQSFFPRRIITNYDTGYDDKKENPAVEMWKSLKEALHGKRITHFDAEVIGRYIRFDERITEIRNKSHKSGNPYSVLVHLETTLEANDGGDIPGMIHTPLLFVPGASKEDMDILASFCVAHQAPSNEDIESYQKTGIFKEKVYEIYKERKAYLKTVLSELNQLEEEGKLKSYKQRHLKRLLNYLK